MSLYATFRQRGVLVRAYLVPRAQWAHGEDCEGVWLPSDHRIEILDDLDPVHVQRVFCHEMTHAILDLGNYELTHDEAFVDNVGGGFWEVWTTFKAAAPRKKRKRSAKTSKR